MLLESWQSEIAEALINNEAECLAVSPKENFALYRDHYFAVLTQALQNIYPRIYQMIGKERFEELAKRYITHYPSMSANLDEYGAYFDQFLTGAAEIKSFTHLPELARFEWAYHCRSNLSNNEV